jgi:CIC family chloride channel protein
MWPVIRRVLVRIAESRGAAAFLTAALIVGIVVGVSAAALVWGIGGAAWLVERVDEAGGFGRWLAIASVPVGMLISWTLDRIWGPGVSGGGVTETMVGLSLRGGYLATRTIGPKIAATAATLGFGGSAGREGPVVQIGATIGSSFGRYTRFGEDQVRSLVAAGAAAGIGASFNAPIAGMLFAMEVILGNFALRHLNAVVVASVAAAVTTRELVGEERILTAPSHSLGHPAELVLYGILGVVAAVIGVLFLRAVARTEAMAERYSGPLVPIVSGLLVGGLIVTEPAVFGTGQEVLAEILRLEFTANRLWIGFLAIALVKIVAAAVTHTGGGSGGTMMPSLFIGGSIGAALALLLQPVWTVSELNIGAFAVVGMAATFAATGRAPLTSILIVFEITGDYNLVLPLMLAAASATFLVERFYPDSVYTIPLRRKGIVLTQTEDIDLLDTVTVSEVMTDVREVLTPDMTVGDAAAAMYRGRHHGLPVVDDGKLVGIATITDLESRDDDVRLGDAMTSEPVTASPKMPVSGALARMASLGVGRLPVVSDDSPGTLVGMFRR